MGYDPDGCQLPVLLVGASGNRSSSRGHTSGSSAISRICAASGLM